MKRKCIGVALTALAAAVVSGGALAGPSSPAMLASACAGCHGTFGGSVGPSMPSLAGQSKEAIAEAMKKFKSGERFSTIMGRLAKGYDDADFAAMGEYFSGRKLHATEQNLDAAKVARGASLQKASCSGCHLENGKAGDDDTPALASQWLPYLEIQMAQYLSGKRKIPERMDTKMKQLSQADLEALLHFYASVK